MLQFSNKITKMEPTRNPNQDFRPTESNLEPTDQGFDAIAREKQERRFKNGLLWMGGGALTLVSSFAINFLCFQCGVDFHLPMYVLTSVGALGCLKGMMSIF
jgi:hypothetical protein